MTLPLDENQKKLAAFFEKWTKEMQRHQHYALLLQEHKKLLEGQASTTVLKKLTDTLDEDLWEKYDPFVKKTALIPMNQTHILTLKATLARQEKIAEILFYCFFITAFLAFIGSLILVLFALAAAVLPLAAVSCTFLLFAVKVSNNATEIKAKINAHQTVDEVINHAIAENQKFIEVKNHEYTILNDINNKLKPQKQLKNPIEPTETHHDSIKVFPT